MKVQKIFVSALCILLCLTGCGNEEKTLRDVSAIPNEEWETLEKKFCAGCGYRCDTGTF